MLFHMMVLFVTALLMTTYCHGNGRGTYTRIRIIIFFRIII